MVNVLYVNGLRFNGRNVGLKEVVFAFNHAAQQTDESDTVQVLDIFYPPYSHYAFIQMRSVEAAKCAKERLHRSWLFEKFITVYFGRKLRYVYFDPNRAQPSSLVSRLFSNSYSAGKKDGATKVPKEKVEDSSDSKPQLQEVFIVKMPMGMTRHFRPGTTKPDGMNNRFICTSREEEDEREVVRERLSESPVLYTTGIETKSGRPLTRYDLIQLFSCYGEVVDCGVFLRRRRPLSSASERPNPRSYALIQMNGCEQATRAMHSLDYTWQMGRFIKVTYSHQTSILVTNSSIKLKYHSKSPQKENE